MRFLATVLSAAIVVFLSSINTRADQTNTLGQDVQILTQNGKPVLGVQYAYDIAAVAFNLTATVVAQSLPAGRPLFVRAYDSQAATYISDWYAVDLGSNSPVFVLSLDRKSALKCIKTLPNLMFVFSSDRATNQAKLDLKPLCQNHAGNFVDMTLIASGCAPDRALLNSVPKEVGGLCSPVLHKDYCAPDLEMIRNAISKQQQCVFKCDGQFDARTPPK